jgi:hypothetical protein
LENFVKGFTALSYVEKFGIEEDSDEEMVNLSGMREVFLSLCNESLIKKGYYSKKIEIKEPSEVYSVQRKVDEESDDGELDELLNITEESNIRNNTRIEFVEAVNNNPEETKELEEWLDDVL